MVDHSEVEVDERRVRFHHQRDLQVDGRRLELAQLEEAQSLVVAVVDHEFRVAGVRRLEKPLGLCSRVLSVEFNACFLNDGFEVFWQGMLQYSRAGSQHYGAFMPIISGMQVTLTAPYASPISLF